MTTVQDNDSPFHGLIATSHKFNGPLQILLTAVPDLQCTTTGWLPVLLWIADISFITLVMVARWEQLPSGLQLVMCNWTTWWVRLACIKITPNYISTVILLWKLSSIPSHYRRLICAWWIPPWHFPPSDQPCSLQTESVQSEANTGNTSPAVFNSTCSYESHCARVGLATCPFSTKSQSITMTPHFLSWTIFQKSLAVDSMGLWAMMNALCCLYPCKRKMQLMK